jgi:hypothetical protein
MKQFIGWMGAVFIVSAHILNTTLNNGVANFEYYVLNTFGSLGIVLVTWKVNWQAFVINVFWFLVSLVGIIKISH